MSTYSYCIQISCPTKRWRCDKHMVAQMWQWVPPSSLPHADLWEAKGNKWWVCSWPWRNNTATIHYHVFDPPLWSPSICSSTRSDSPAALTEHSDETMQVLFSFCSACLMSKEARGSRREHFWNQGPSQTLVMKRIDWHKAGPTLARLLCWWISPALYVDRCYSCRGTINSVVIIIDFPQVIIISHILDIRGFNAALQMAFWLIGKMLEAGTKHRGHSQKICGAAALPGQPVFVPFAQSQIYSWYLWLFTLSIKSLDKSCKSQSQH